MDTNSGDVNKEPEKNKPKLSKEEKLRQEKLLLEEAIREHRVDSIREKVAYILNNYPAARNSDKKLALAYWNCFQNESFDYAFVEKIFKLEHVPTLSRERAKIQNDYGLFQATEKVRKRRGGLELEKQEVYAPGEDIERRITVYADESGKSDHVMTVGGVWFLDPDKYYDIWVALKEYKKEFNIKSEVKFSALTKNNWKIILGYVDKFLQCKGFTSFKIVCLATRDLRRPTEEALYDLYRHFLIEGAQFEVGEGRITLPRAIELMKDRDEGSDIINLRDMQIKLLGDLNIKFENKLKLVDVGTIRSDDNHVMQLVDLMIGSFSRVANRVQGASLNHKDEFANELLSKIGVDIKSLSSAENSDWLQITKLG